MTRKATDATRDPMETPNEGGAYIINPQTGEYSRDGKTQQTREPDQLVVRESAQDPVVEQAPVDQKDRTE